MTATRLLLFALVLLAAAPSALAFVPVLGVTEVPEPGTLALCAIGIAAAARMRF